MARTGKRADIIGPGGHLAHRRSFTGNSMRGNVTPAYAEQGQLPTAHYVALIDAIHAAQVIYLVYSYSTPIAWVLRTRGEPDTVVIPDVRYSQSTSAHQASARAWLTATVPAGTVPA